MIKRTFFISLVLFLTASAVDLYYQARPTLLINKIVTTVGFIYSTADGYGLAREIHRTGLGGRSYPGAFFPLRAVQLRGGLGDEGDITIHPVMSLNPDLRTECFRIALGIQL